MDRCCVCAPSRKERPGAAKGRMRVACSREAPATKEQTSKLRQRRMCGPLLPCAPSSKERHGAAKRRVRVACS